MKKDKTAREIDQGGVGKQRSGRNNRATFHFPLRVLQVAASVLLTDSWRAQSWHPGVEGGRGTRGASSSVTGTSRLRPSGIFPGAKICLKWLSWSLLFHTHAQCWYGSHNYICFWVESFFFFCNQTAWTSVNLMSKKSESFSTNFNSTGGVAVGAMLWHHCRLLRFLRNSCWCFCTLAFRRQQSSLSCPTSARRVCTRRRVRMPSRRYE